MPTSLHVTYCGRKGITGSEVDMLEKNVDCDDCIQAKAWKENEMTTETMGVKLLGHGVV